MKQIGYTHYTIFSILSLLSVCSPAPEGPSVFEQKGPVEPISQSIINVFPHAVIRMEPSVSAPKVGILEYGTPVTVMEESKETSSLLGFEEKNWLLIRGTNTEGWVYGPLVLRPDTQDRRGLMHWKGRTIYLLDPEDRQGCIDPVESEFPSQFNGGFFAMMGGHTAKERPCEFAQQICLRPDGSAYLNMSHVGSNGVWKATANSIQITWTSSFDTHNNPEIEVNGPDTQHLRSIHGFLIYFDGGEYIREVCLQNLH